MQGAATVRRATRADFETALPLLVRFLAEEGFDTPPEQIRTQLVGMLTDEDSAVFLAWADHVAVGVATVTTSSGIELGLSAELEDLYVLAEARRRGVGSALIQEAMRWCRARGCTLVLVVVTAEGQATHHLIEYYRSRGFHETGRTLLFAPLQQQVQEAAQV